MLGKRGENMAPNDQVRATEVKENNGHPETQNDSVEFIDDDIPFNKKGQT